MTGQVDQVLHFAALATPIDHVQLPIETMKGSSTGALHALGLAKEKGARFLLASHSEIYGHPQVHPQPETYWRHVNPVGPRGVYDSPAADTRCRVIAQFTQLLGECADVTGRGEEASPAVLDHLVRPTRVGGDHR